MTHVFLSIGLLLGAPPADTPEGRREMLENVERILAAIDAAHRGIPRDTFDVQGVIATAGRDPAKLFEWVRDRTAWVPYQGCLRGSTGVLLDRVGNSLDRSLLLAELLESAGHKARLARATLPEAEAGALLKELRATAASPASAGGVTESPSADDIEAARLAEEAAGRIAARAAALREALKLPPADAGAAQREAEAALRDHWWIEVEAEGAWTALDPLLPDAAPGSARLAPSGTIEASKGPRRFDLPGASCHEVEIRIVVERLAEGELSEKGVVSITLRPSELIGRRVTLFHHPLAWPEGLRLGGDKGSEDLLKKTLLAQKEWLPILQVGGFRTSKGSFTDTGEVNETPVLDPRAKLGRGIGRGLGGLGGISGGEEKKTEAALTAEWLDFEIRVPGRPARKFRRELFDILGPGGRAAKPASLEVDESRRLDRALALFGETEILLLCAQLTPEIVAHLDAQEILKRRSGFKALASVEDPARWKDAAGQLAWEAVRPRPLEAFAVLRGDLSRFTGDVFLDRPNAVTYTRRYGWDAKAGMSARDTIDVVSNEVAVRRGAAVDPGLVRLEQGVTDTVAEDLALGNSLAVTENTATVFELAEAAGSPALVLRGAGPPLEAASAAWPPGVKERVAGDIAAGFAVVIPREAVLLGGSLRTGWWRVDPATGDAIGVMDTGFNSADAEYTETTVITTREQALRRYLEWFVKQPSMRYYRTRYGGAGRYDMARLRGIQNLQRIAQRTLDEMQYLGIGM